MKRGQGGYQQSILLPITGGKQSSHGEAAKQSAIDRIDKYFLKLGGEIYYAFSDLEPGALDQAVKADVKQRGSGVRFILQTLETKNLEANRTRKVGAA